MNPSLAATADDSFAEFLDFGAGVLALVCLSCSVIWGLVAQDRILLVARQRILAQAVHRGTAVASIVFLLVHVGVKLALAHTTWVAAVIPFGLLLTDDEQFGGRAFLIGLGTLAGLLMIFVGVTGALRNRFASPAPVAARWRAMHMLAYPAWSAALLHGLYAGRAAKPVFLVLYGLSLAGVMAALALRAAPGPVKRRIADRVAALLDQGGRRAERAEPAQDGARAASDATATATLPGYETAGVPRQRTAAHPQSYEAAAGPYAPAAAPYEAAAGPYESASAAAREPANGFAAAYRAVSTPQRDWQQPAAAPAGAMPPGGWPVPSPPPVGEAPPSAYDPLTDTGHTIPAYGNPDPYGYRSSDVYDTGETNTVPGPYYPDDTYTSGPAPEPAPGASYDFDAPGPGEPWNTPSGGI
ncbi:cytochrome b/b6 domain-containing protein [Streptomyces sp. NPDC023723]|uniref:cytochrome b/b6 domain-containing protein n=1 Tax=Streptomyces sp. NPDC023723 TaxID=3154323 RepID=UPI003401F313